MNLELFNFFVNHQLNMNNNDLEFFKTQLSLYEFLMKHTINKNKKDKYKKKIDIIYKNIEIKINDICDIINL